MLPDALARAAEQLEQLAELDRLEIVRRLLDHMSSNATGLETRARGHVVYRDPEFEPLACSAFFSFAGINLTNHRLLGALYFIALLYIVRAGRAPRLRAAMPPRPAIAQLMRSWPPRANARRALLPRPLLPPVRLRLACAVSWHLFGHR
jgi:hypothetical protein